MIKASGILNSEKIKEGSLVWDMISDKNGFVVSTNPLTIRLDSQEELIVERNPSQIMIYLYDEKDIEEINSWVSWIKNMF